MDRTSQVRVAMVDQHALFTECLGMVLSRRNYEVHGVPIPDGEGLTAQLLTRLRALRPDVLLVNADLGPHCDGAALIAPMVRAGVAVVVVLEHHDEASRGRCLEQGASAVLPKSASLASAVSVVRRVNLGLPVLDRSERDRLVELHRRRVAVRRDAHERLQHLSPQEGEVLRHLMSGLTVREIATVRVVSESTVRTQVKAVLAKLRISSQIAAVALAHKAGWEARPLAVAH